jgi:hypothetical protein
VIEVIFGLLHFLEQQSFPHPLNTGDVFWDESNVKIKSLFEDVAIYRENKSYSAIRIFFINISSLVFDLLLNDNMPSLQYGAVMVITIL